MVEDRLEREFSPQVLEAVRRTSRDLDKDKGFEAYMRHLESLLVEAGVELTRTQRDYLRRFLIENGRMVGWPSEDNS